MNQSVVIVYQEFEDTKGGIRIRISKKDRQHNGRIKTNNLQNIYIKLKIEDIKS